MNRTSTDLARTLRRKHRKARWVLRRRLRSLRRAGTGVGTGAAGKAWLALSPMLVVVYVAASATLADAYLDTGRSGTTSLLETRGQRSLERYREVRLTAARPWAEAFGISVGLADLIHSAALDEGLDPALAFRLVRVESSFRRKAVGPAGSVGYTQVKPSTARWLDPTVTREKLFEAETNLRLGFRYLGMLLRQYDNDARLALVAYNRGPGTVAAILAMGQDPANGYAMRVLGRPPGQGDTEAAADEEASEDAGPEDAGPEDAAELTRKDDDPEATTPGDPGSAPPERGVGTS